MELQNRTEAPLGQSTTFPENQGQPNGSSHADYPSRIREFFDENYKKWSPQRLDESHPRSRGSGHVGASADIASTNQAAQTPNFLSEVKRTETTSESPKQHIHGFENQILSLKNVLLNQKDSEEFKTLAVVGSYGVGKTALCQTIFNNEEVKNAYVPRVWVSMYQEGEREDGDTEMAIVKRILGNLGVEEEMLERVKKDAEKEKGAGAREEELARLLYVLYLNLWGKKYLIVLDDAREEDGWKERLDQDKIPDGNKWGTHLSCGFPKGSGGRVIVTSRDEQLAEKLVGEEYNLHRLYPLSDPDSVWKIYKDAADECQIEVNPRNERKYREDLMNKSCGIPLAARMLGRNQPVEEEPTTTVEEAAQEGSTNGTTTQNI